MSADDFRAPWSRLEGDLAGRFEREASLEIAPGHELDGLGLAAIAKCEGCESVVFRLPDETFAIVHLSWIGKPDTPPWPTTTRLGGYIAAEAAMDQHEH